MTNAMTVLVTGASGTLGTAVLPRLIKDGHDVRPMSRRARPGWVAADLVTGAGLTEAVGAVDAIVHLASSPGKTRQTDVEGTRRLLAAAKTAGVRHVLFMSIVGIERVPVSYYRMKIAAEGVVQAGGVPYTILRATQFPSLVDTLLTVSSKLGPVVVDKSLVVQPVHVDDVAERIADLLAGEARGETVEFGGPEVLRFDQAVRDWQAARGTRRPVWSLRLPGRIVRVVRDGGLTTTAKPAGTRTWQDYLAVRY
jgi:uncharacterized protein YbjT (DUF2867 family)